VPRDYFNLELRHHQMLFIVVILPSFLDFGGKITHYSVNPQIFGRFFCSPKREIKKNG
jgi:hypothetical protein